MSAVKRYLEEHIHEIPDEVLRDIGYSEEDIKTLRECFPEQIK